MKFGGSLLPCRPAFTDDPSRLTWTFRSCHGLLLHNGPGQPPTGAEPRLWTSDGHNWPIVMPAFT